jgi:hypothetical protein
VSNVCAVQFSSILISNLPVSNSQSIISGHSLSNSDHHLMKIHLFIISESQSKQAFDISTDLSSVEDNRQSEFAINSLFEDGTTTLNAKRDANRLLAVQ